MKKFFVFFLSFIVAASALSAQTTRWELDPSHSELGFRAKHLLIATTKGKFTDYKVTVLSDKADFTDAKIEVIAKVKSIFTDNNDRDNHLRSADFFDAEKYPELKFVGKSVKKVSGNKYKVTGDLTMKNVTKTVTLDMEFGGVVKDPWGNTKAGFTLTGELNRFDYGLAWNKAIETGGLVVDKMIKLDIEIELGKK
ncbi:MAG TPA: YceI family protein [Candidatus Kapabacteria bacterium]|jgi:polyisoprenoid-binding protein YceI|nr:polyisoprenoid-binding protein [Ignavibacteria bacterium]HRE57634.1 YceI family protein [Candidatus Kapabacteria bacterium]HRK59722.1 YceI family protein [Candidatus Kapabacteria bacterium]